MAGTYSERTRTPRFPPPAPAVPPPLAAWASVADVARLPDRLARRIAQFAQNADAMQPPARARLAASLAAETAAHVSPVPAVDPETFLRGVVAVRRDRELRALQLEEQRVAALTPARPALRAASRSAEPPLAARRAVGAGSVPVVVELVRPVDRHADVRRLLGSQLGQLHAERGEVQPRDLLVERLRQRVDADRVRVDVACTARAARAPGS